jgi:hypothetical protein
MQHRVLHPAQSRRFDSICSVVWKGFLRGCGATDVFGHFDRAGLAMHLYRHHALAALPGDKAILTARAVSV